MKITFILPTVNMSGGIRVVAIYAEALSKRGHDVVLVSPPPKRISFKTNLKSFLKGNGWEKTVIKNSHADNLSIEHRILEKYRPVEDKDVDDADIIIATWWETAEWVMNLSSRKGAKVYFIQHHEVHSGLPLERCKATYAFPMHKIVIAEWLRKVMLTEYGENDVDLVSNGVDHEQFFANERHKQEKPTVGFLYHKAEFKGVDITIKAITTLFKKHSNLRIVSFGSMSPSETETFCGRLKFYLDPPQDLIRELYSQCDVWITSSRLEGFNLPAMEAMACRTPVISTKAGWPEEVIKNGYNGALVDVDDVNAIVNETESIINLSDASWKCMSENAYNTVSDSSWGKSAMLFEKSLEKALLNDENKLDTRKISKAINTCKK